MALRQHAKGLLDDLNKLSDQQLRSILNEELDSEDVNVELIKNITDVLAARTNEAPIDVEAAYQKFFSQYADTELLFSEMEQELGGLNANEETPDALRNEPEENHKKVVHFSRMTKLGILVAAILVLFLAGSIVAYAFGFHIWQADVSWDKDNMMVLSGGGEASDASSDPYSSIRKALVLEGIDWPVVPFYIPAGFSLHDFQAFDTPQGKVYYASFSSNNQKISFRYTLHPNDYNVAFPKDDEVEIYNANGIEHFVSSNEGRYRAVWENRDVICEIHGVETKEELLKIIDSIYKE